MKVRLTKIKREHLIEVTVENSVLYDEFKLLLSLEEAVTLREELGRTLLEYGQVRSGGLAVA